MHSGFLHECRLCHSCAQTQWLPTSFRERPSRLAVACKALGEASPVAALTACPTAFLFSRCLHLPGQLGYRTLKPLSPSAWNTAIDLLPFLITILLFKKNSLF